jgi:hypothetical protein
LARRSKPRALSDARARRRESGLDGCDGCFDHGERTRGTGAGASGLRGGTGEGVDRIVFARAGKEFDATTERDEAGAALGDDDDAVHGSDDGDWSAGTRER